MGDEESLSENQPKLKSTHLGLVVSINSIFFFCNQPLIYFSLEMACFTSEVSSK